MQHSVEAFWELYNSQLTMQSIGIVKNILNEF